MFHALVRSPISASANFGLVHWVGEGVTGAAQLTHKHISRVFNCVSQTPMVQKRQLIDGGYRCGKDRG
jgi:hypothetical protein